MKQYFEVFRNCSLFDGIKDENLMAILGCFGAKVKNFCKRETILAEGEPLRYIGIVLSGTAQIVQMDYFGNRSIMAEVGPSELFGESFACAGMAAMPVDVIANEAMEVLLIDHFRIVQPCSNTCEFHKQLIYNLMKILATKNLIFYQKIEITSKRTTREKLMTYLLLQAKQRGSTCFEIPYDRQELADYLQVERSGLSVEISKLRREGVLKSERNRFELTERVEFLL